MTKRFQYALFAVTCFFVFFIHIGADEIDTMEAYNWVTAREMVEEHHWLVPTMKEDIRIAKPPFPTWVTAGVIDLAGKTNSYGMMRIPGAFMAIMLVIATWGFVKSYTKDEELAFFTAMILCVNALVMVSGRKNTWDIFTTAFMMFALWALFDGLQRKEQKKSVFIVAGLFLGLTFMSKWIVSFYVLLFPFLTAYIYEFGFEKLREKKSGLYLCTFVFLLIACPWPLYILFKCPQLSMITKNLEVSAWTKEHVRSFYFYLHFPLFSGIWTAFLLAYFVKPFSASRVGSRKHYFFPLIWFCLGLFLLMVIPEKKDRFLLPLSVPMSLMAGYMVKSLIVSFRENNQSPGDKRLMTIHTVLLVILSGSLPFVELLSGNHHAASVQFIFALSASMILIFFAIYLRYKGLMTAMFIESTLLVCLFMAIAWPLITKVDHEQRGFQSVKELLKIEEVKGKTLYYIDPVHITVIWDLGEIAKIRKIRQGDIIPVEKKVILFPGNLQLADFKAAHPEFDYKMIRELRYSPIDKDRKMLVTLLTPKPKG